MAAGRVRRSLRVRRISDCRSALADAVRLAVALWARRSRRIASSAFFLLLLHIVTAMSAWFGVTYGEEERGKYAPRARHPRCLRCSLSGCRGVLLSSGLASFLLFWEAMSLAGFFLVMVDGEASSRRAALLYLAVAQFGAGALLVGLGLLSCGQLTMTFAALGTSGRHAVSHGFDARHRARVLRVHVEGRSGTVPRLASGSASTARPATRRH